MDLKHDPSEGVSVETDLSRTTVTLTRLRGAPVVFTILLLAVLVAAAGVVGKSSVWTYFFPAALGISGLLNMVKTEVAFGPHAVTIRTLWFGRERSSDVVPYETIREVAQLEGGFGGPTLQITRVDGSGVSIAHGTAEDLAELHRDLDARRPIQPLPADGELAPESIQRLRSAQQRTGSS